MMSGLQAEMIWSVLTSRSGWSTYTAKVFHKFENHGDYKSLFKAINYVFVHTVFLRRQQLDIRSIVHHVGIMRSGQQNNSPSQKDNNHKQTKKIAKIKVDWPTGPLWGLTTESPLLAITTFLSFLHYKCNKQITTEGFCY